ncbi:MAG: DUF362 domain-containing protein [Candidatus Hodarchaeota archaeon]
MNNSIVGIEKIEIVDDKEKIRDALYSLLNYMKIEKKIAIPKKGKIIIKPNICYIQGYETGTTVDPFIVQCLVEWILNNYEIETIVIAEADATDLNVDLAFKALGWEHMINTFSKVKLLNLTNDELVDVKLNGLYFKKLKMSKTYMSSDYFISVAKLKTHTMCNISCILKNQFGSKPSKNKSRYHKNLNEVIYDLNKVRIPDLCIVDGIIAMEGAGPIDGIPKAMGIIIMGDDPVAVDHACAKIMKIDPNKISHLKLSYSKNLGTFKYELFGKNVEDVSCKFNEGNSLWKKLIIIIANMIIKIINFTRIAR